MRAINLLIITSWVLAAASVTSAAETEFQLTPRGGNGHLRIDIPQRAALTPDTLGAGVGAGLLTPFGLILEAGVERFGHYTFLGFDEFRFDQNYLAAGYQFELGQWRVVPKVGWSDWDLDHSGILVARRDRRELSGQDYFWEIGVSRQISRLVTLGLSHENGNYDFGNAHATRFVVTLGFGDK